MDTTIRNLDADAYRALKAHAARAGTTIGAVLNEAIRAYLDRSSRTPVTGGLADVEPEGYPPGNEQVSEKIDAIVARDAGAHDPSRRLALFDRATERQLTRQAGRGQATTVDRGWRREDLYDRGRAG